MSKKRSVFIGMSSGFGPLAQIIPMALELKKEKYELVCQIERLGRDMVKSMGISLIELPEIHDPKINNPGGPEWWNLDYFWGKYGYLDYFYVKELIQAYIKEIEKLEPEIIISAFHPPSVVAAKKLGIPLVCVTQACAHPYGKGGRTTWWKELPMDLKRTSPILNKVLEEIGLEPISKMEDLNIGDLTIIPSIPEFDIIDSHDAFYTGPMLWQGPDEFLDSNYKIEKVNRYLIYVYIGYLYSYEGNEKGMVLLRNIVDAFKNTEFDVVVSTGIGQSIPADFLLPPNIIVKEWVPVNTVIPNCDLVIHHGGHGSCLQAFSHGVPSLVLPTIDEREYNARQLTEMGVGLFIALPDIRPDLVLQKARSILSDQNMKKKSKALSKTIIERNYQGAIKGAKKILKLIN